MCGIAGIYHFENDSKADPQLIKRMCSVLTHRGPDDEGIYLKDNIALGQRRLSIIDLASGHQPMASEDRSLWIIFNGEIYNFLELREELIQKGCRFKTRCDTEVILYLYQEEKENCVHRLNGMFAFVIWDEKEQKLFMARDRLGVKPLVYSVSNGRLIFASEIKAILEDPTVKRQINFEALHDYLSLLYVPQPNTMFKGIHKLPAGHFLVCNKRGIQIKQYWDIDFSKTIRGSEEEISETLYLKFKEAVKKRLISDVPLGAFLSGGVDSSSVVSMMSELGHNPIVTNSIGFEKKSFDELEYARLVSKKFNTLHHEDVVKMDALEILDKLTWFYDEPFGDSSSIPTYYVSKMARQNFTVALSGDGGDENFAGYGRYRYSQALVNSQKYTPSFLKNLLQRLSVNFLPYSGNFLASKINNKLEETFLSPFDLYFKIVTTYREKEKFNLYGASLKKELQDYSTKEKLRAIFQKANTGDYISQLQYLDMKTYLCDDILTKVDIASMANSLEVRSPFLDYELMEYIAQIPSRLKLKNGNGKYIFKQSMRNHLPSEILNRSKMGFAVPLNDWLQTKLRTWIEQELFGKDSIIGELFDLNAIKKIWHLVLHDRSPFFTHADLSGRIWLLFLLSCWHRKYIRNEHLSYASVEQE